MWVCASVHVFHLIAGHTLARIDHLNLGIVASCFRIQDDARFDQLQHASALKLSSPDLLCCDMYSSPHDTVFVHHKLFDWW